MPEHACKITFEISAHLQRAGILRGGSHQTCFKTPLQSECMVIHPFSSPVDSCAASSIRCIAINPTTDDASEKLPDKAPRPLEHSKMKAVEQRFGAISCINDPPATAVHVSSQMATFIQLLSALVIRLAHIHSCPQCIKFLPVFMVRPLWLEVVSGLKYTKQLLRFWMLSISLLSLPMVDPAGTVSSS